MASPVFTIEPNPHWVIIDNFSKLPNGAAIYTYRSLDPSQFKPAFQDSAGQTPFGQPIVGMDNGTMPPIFWEFDPASPSDTYYIRVYDSSDLQTQQFLWDFDGLSGSPAGSGGGTVVTATAIQNLVYNNVFFRNIGNQAGSPSLPATITLAPGSHEGFVNDPGNASVIANGPAGPDIVFAKNNTSASDSITFTDYTPLGTRYIPGKDISPKTFMTYACTAPGAVELYKYIQFPISQGVQNLSSQQVTVRFTGTCNSGNNQVVIQLRQFYGSGGAPSPDSLLALPAITLGNSTTVWTVQTLQAIVPDATGKTLGTCGNDGLFLQVGFPLNSATSISFTKPEMFLGTVPPDVQYENNDKIDSVINTPRTGDIRISVNGFQPYGWVVMNDGTIANGNPAIVPPAGGFARNNIDTFPLYDLLWNLPISVVPEYDSAGVALVARGGSSVSDFTANRQLALTKAAGRVFAGVSPSHLIGTTAGTETHNISVNELPQHTHDGPGGNIFLTNAPVLSLTGPGGVNVGNSSVTGGITGYAGPSALSLLQPTTWMNIYIKL